MYIQHAMFVWIDFALYNGIYYKKIAVSYLFYVSLGKGQF